MPWGSGDARGHGPRPERAALDQEHTREQLVVGQAGAPARRPPAPPGRTPARSGEEDGHGCRDAGAALGEEERRPVPDEGTDRRVGQSERREAREGDQVRREPDDDVEELDRRLGGPGRSPSGAGPQADEGQHQPDQPHDHAGDGDRVLTQERPERDRAEAQEQRAAGNARGRVERQRPTTLAVPVDGAEDVRAGEQHGADADRCGHQPDRLVERVQPESRDHSGRTEELAVERAEPIAATPPPRTNGQAFRTLPSNGRRADQGDAR